MSEFIWFNSNIKVDNKSVHFSFFFLVKTLTLLVNCSILSLGRTKIEFDFKDTHKIYWLQIIDAFSKSWKDIISKDKGNAKHLVIFTTTV